jgi:TolA-binding protein
LKRELRREIKQDEFASWLESVIGWANGHRDEMRIGVGVAVVLLAAFEAPVTTELPPGADRPAGQVFATAEDKYKTAAAAFEGVARRYGSMDVGVRARYYAALSRIELGQNAEAEKALREIQGAGGDSLVPELARLALAGLYRRSGETDRAVEAYRGVVSNPDTSLPRDYALNCMAGTLEDAKRYAEARAVYRELVEEFPASVYAARARARVDYLQGAQQG